MKQKAYGDISKADLLTEGEQEKSVVISDPSRPDMPMIFISEEFEKQTGYSPEESLGCNCRFLQGPDTDPKTVKAIREALEAETEIKIDIVNYKKDGTKFINQLHIRPLLDDNGEVMFFVGVQNPI